MQREFPWLNAAAADMPGAATAYALCEAVRAAMADSAPSTGHEEVRALTRRIVHELREEGYEPQTVLLAVKEVLQRAGLGMHVDEARHALWRTVIDWTIRDYYRTD